MNNGTPCLFEAARHSLSAPKPSVDHLQLSQLGMSRRLLNPQLYELHDDASETTWAVNDAGHQTEDVVERAATENTDNSISEMVKDTADEPELNGQSASDQEEIWSDCAAELHPAEDGKPDDDQMKDCTSPQNLSCTAVQKNTDCATESEPARMRTECCQSDADCCLAEHAKIEMDLVTSESRHSSPTNQVSKTTAPATVTMTTTDNIQGSANTNATTTTTAKATSTAASKATSTTACTTSLTSTTSSSKSERPRASPCRAAQTKHQPPVTSGRESKLPPCKASSPAAATAKQSASINNAAAAKLLVDMVGRSKSAAGLSSSCAGAGGQCKLTQCTDKIHSDAVSSVTDSGSCTAEKMSRSTSTAAASGTADRKDGKFCECWHCEFFGHMSVSHNNNNNHNNNNDNDNVYGAVIVAPATARVHPVHMMSVERRQMAADPQTWPNDPGSESDCRLLETTPTITITNATTGHRRSHVSFHLLTSANELMSFVALCMCVCVCV